MGTFPHESRVSEVMPLHPLHQLHRHLQVGSTTTKFLGSSRLVLDSPRDSPRTTISRAKLCKWTPRTRDSIFRLINKKSWLRICLLRICKLRDIPSLPLIALCLTIQMSIWIGLPIYMGTLSANLQCHNSRWIRCWILGSFTKVSPRLSQAIEEVVRSGRKVIRRTLHQRQLARLVVSTYAGPH